MRTLSVSPVSTPTNPMESTIWTTEWWAGLLACEQRIDQRLRFPMGHLATWIPVAALKA